MSTIDTLSDDELALAAKAVSIHRVSLRRKLDRLLERDVSERAVTLVELEVSQALLAKLNRADLSRARSGPAA